MERINRPTVVVRTTDALPLSNVLIDKVITTSDASPCPFAVAQVRTSQLEAVKRQPMDEAVFVHLDRGEITGSVGMTPVADICDGEIDGFGFDRRGMFPRTASANAKLQVYFYLLVLLLTSLFFPIPFIFFALLVLLVTQIRGHTVSSSTVRVLHLVSRE